MTLALLIGIGMVLGGILLLWKGPRQLALLSAISIIVSVFGIMGVGVIYSQQSQEKEQSSQARALLSSIEQAQAAYYETEGRYAPTLTDLRIFSLHQDDTLAAPPLNDALLTDDAYMETSFKGDGYFALVSDESFNEQFSISAEDGYVTNRNCEATERQECYDGRWEGEQQ